MFAAMTNLDCTDESESWADLLHESVTELSVQPSSIVSLQPKPTAAATHHLGQRRQSSYRIVKVAQCNDEIYPADHFETSPMRLFRRVDHILLHRLQLEPLVDW